MTGEIKSKFIKLASVFCIVVCLYSCSNSSEPSCKVTNFNPAVLFFDELKFTPFSYNPNFEGDIKLFYQNERVNQIKGGLVNLALAGQPYFMFDNDVRDVIYEGNTITVSSKNLYTKEFVIQSNRLVSQKTTYSNLLHYNDLMSRCDDLLNYEYGTSEITETCNGLLRRKFYMSGGNLERVELFRYGFNNVITKKIEYVFSEYNSEPNLLKGKYFIDGNFFSAFSNNNFKRVDVKFYDFINGIYEYKPLEDAYFAYGELPTLFVEDCQ